MKVVNMGNIADAFKFDDLPATGIVIEATPKELKLLPNLAYKDVTISEHVSNAAAMRDALEKVRFYLPYFLQYMRLHREDEKAGGYYESILEVVSAALSEPPRNCDVGTAAEQHERFYNFCDKVEECKECPLWRGGGLTSKCSVYWAQLPYEEGAEDEGK